MGKTYKCYICKKTIRLFDPIITFYSPTLVGESDDSEYNFCTENCVNKFLGNRTEFWEIVRNIDVSEKEQEN